MNARNIIVVLLSVAVVAWHSPQAQAHALLLSVFVDSKVIRVEARYDGSDHDGGPITVRLVEYETDREVGKKPLDSQGQCDFPRPGNGKYRIIAEDGVGHRKEQVIMVSEDQIAISDKPENREWMMLLGLGIIAILTLAGWFWMSRKPSERARGT